MIVDRRWLIERINDRRWKKIDDRKSSIDNRQSAIPSIVNRQFQEEV